MADNVTYCNCIKSVQTKLVSISLWGNMADNVTLTATVQRVFKQLTATVQRVFKQTL